MDEQPTLLIVDRNPYIRSFLKRELEAAGYRIVLAANCRQTLEQLAGPHTPDLIILDPDLPDSEDALILQQIYALRPGLPVIVHPLCEGCEFYLQTAGAVACIEKSGNSIEGLKRAVRSFLPGC